MALDDIRPVEIMSASALAELAKRHGYQGVILIAMTPEVGGQETLHIVTTEMSMSEVNLRLDMAKHAVIFGALPQQETMN